MPPGLRVGGQYLSTSTVPLKQQPPRETAIDRISAKVRQLIEHLNLEELKRADEESKRVRAEQYREYLLTCAAVNESIDEDSPARVPDRIMEPALESATTFDGAGPAADGCEHESFGRFLLIIFRFFTHICFIVQILIFVILLVEFIDRFKSIIHTMYIRVLLRSLQFVLEFYSG